MDLPVFSFYFCVALFFAAFKSEEVTHVSEDSELVFLTFLIFDEETVAIDDSELDAES